MPLNKESTKNIVQRLIWVSKPELLFNKSVVAVNI